MLGKSINFYGYDKQTYKDCREMINSLNRNHIIVINFWFLIVDFIYLIFSALNLFGLNQERVPFYAIYLFISTVFALIVGLLPKFSERRCSFFLYSNIIILLSYGILVSAAQPYLAATLYLILLTLIALTYISTMLRMVLVMMIASAIFLYTSFKFKTFSIAYNDTYNLIIVQLLVIGLHYLFQRMRIQQFVLHHRNLQIQSELEIKSSFDTLTGLLNRGRFFSIADEIIRQTEMNDGSKIALCLIDLDGFKQINDGFGHQMGDKAIQLTGETIIKKLELSEVFRTPINGWNVKNIDKLAGRLGGDEFIAIVRFFGDDQYVSDLMKELLATLNGLNFSGLEKGIEASIGITLINSAGDIDSAYKRADEGLYDSKHMGKNQVKFCNQDFSEEGKQ